MSPFTWNSGKDKTIGKKQISRCQRLGVGGVNYMREFLGGDGSVLYLDWGGSELY